MNQQFAHPSDEWLIPTQIAHAYQGKDAIHFVTPITASFACYQLGVKLADDIVDCDPNLKFSFADATNFSHLLIGLAERAILECPQFIFGEVKFKLLYEILRNVQHIFEGQSLDLKGCETEEEYWRIAELKSANFFALPFILTGIGLQLSLTEQQHLAKLGMGYGFLIQLFDDLEDCMAKECKPDWFGEIRSLPILFAATVPHPDREWFVQLRSEIGSPGNLEKAQSILLTCHAIGYCAYQISEKLAECKRIIQLLTCPNRLALFGMFERFEKALANLMELVPT
ncbi:MAG TPA: polyprenyl synthetase family protein [Anaerolineales bacterium]|nr:polyprenyl synthetase family protein [Anaerolineales bacterium]